MTDRPPPFLTSRRRLLEGLGASVLLPLIPSLARAQMRALPRLAVALNETPLELRPGQPPTTALRFVPETKTRSATQAVKPKKVTAVPDFVAPQLCVSVEQPPNSDGWGHEVKFDGYRVQLRVEDGDVALNTRKGLDWTARFQEIAKAGEALPDGLYDFLIS